MKLISASVGTLAYFFGYQWDVLPDALASLVVLYASYVVIADLWSDPIPPRSKARLQLLVKEVEPRLRVDSSERILKEITDQPCKMNPEVLLSEVLDETDRQWLEEQVQMIVDDAR